MFVCGFQCVCVRARVAACVCVSMAGGASVCFLENTLYLCPDWTPGYKQAKKKNRCGTASGEINLEANKSRRHILIVSRSSTQTITFQIFFFLQFHFPHSLIFVVSRLFSAVRRAIVRHFCAAWMVFHYLSLKKKTSCKIWHLYVSVINVVLLQRSRARAYKVKKQFVFTLSCTEAFRIVV